MKIKGLHFTPENGWFGDAMPLWHNGIYHVYYTKAYHTGTVGWGHISSPDLIEWTENPDIKVVEEDNKKVYNSLTTTGCVIYANNSFHAFYAGKNSDGKMIMMKAVSEDGIDFKWNGKILFQQPDEWYLQDGTWRDPDVFWDDENNCYRMVFCTKVKGFPSDSFIGALGQAVSDDLENWECLAPFIIPGVSRSHECPNIFKTYSNSATKWAMIYYWHETRFNFADSLAGPWERKKVISPDHFDFMAAKTMYDGNRHILVGWIPRKPCDCGERIWGGHMLCPRVLDFDDNGTPTTQFIPELWQIFNKKSEKLNINNFETAYGIHNMNGNEVNINGINRGTYAVNNNCPNDFLIECKVNIINEYTTFMLIINDNQLIFDLAEGILRLRKHYTWDQRNDIAVIPLDVKADKLFNLDIILHDDILEVCVDKRQTLVSRLLNVTKGKLAVSAQNGEVLLKNINCWEL